MKAVILILVLISHFAYAQSWRAPYEIDYSPRVFFTDSTTGQFYVGGNFRTVNSTKCYSIFRVDTIGLIDFMDTINHHNDPPIDILWYKDTLYFAGYNGLYRYIDSTWKPLLEFHIFLDLSIYQDKLLIGGRFINAISNSDATLIQFDGNSFSSFNGLEDLINERSTIYAIQEYKGKIYFGGNFNEDGINEIVSWDGNKWDSMNGGLFGNSGFEVILDMEVYQDELYVAGAFKKEGGSISNNIVKWDGEHWIEIGNGIYGSGVEEMMIYENELWMIGGLDSVDGFKLNNIAIWNGTNWCKPDGDFGRYPITIGTWGDTIVVGGNFNHIDGDTTLNTFVKYSHDGEFECGPEVPIFVAESNSDPEVIHVFPNPFTDIVTFSEDLSGRSFSVYNLQGEIIKKGVIQGMSLNLSELKNGGYIVQVVSENESLRTLVIKE